MDRYNIIVANGLLPRTRKTYNLINDALHVIVCDGAINTYFSYTNRKPDYVIGDGDSANMKVIEKRGLTFIQVDDQETNDLTKAIESGIERGWNNFIIIGATGQREDHTIGNIFLLAKYLSMGIQAKLAAPKGDFIPVQGTFEKKVGRLRTVSIFSIDRKPITATGLEYPIENKVFEELWEGTLNRTTSDYLTIQSEGRYIVYLGKKPSNSMLAREEEEDYDA